MHRVSRALLIALTPLAFVAPAHARGSHRGYHCPLGEYWRPSLGVCQGAPYRSGGYDAPRRPQPDVASAPSALGGRIVNTDTRIVSRRRVVRRDGVTLRYVVVTRVVERYPPRR